MTGKVGNKSSIRGECMRNRILEFIIWYFKEHGYCPTVREIGAGVNLKSTSSVQTHIQKMLKIGMLETDAEVFSPRALRVPGWTFVKMNDDKNN